MSKSSHRKTPKVTVDFGGKPKPGGGRYPTKSKGLSKNLEDRRGRTIAGSLGTAGASQGVLNGRMGNRKRRGDGDHGIKARRAF